MTTLLILITALAAIVALILLARSRRSSSKELKTRKPTRTPIAWKVMRGGTFVNQYETREAANASATEIRLESRYIDVPVEVHPVYGDE